MLGTEQIPMANTYYSDHEDYFLRPSCILHEAFPMSPTKLTPGWLLTQLCWTLIPLHKIFMSPWYIKNTLRTVSTLSSSYLPMMLIWEDLDALVKRSNGASGWEVEVGCLTKAIENYWRKMTEQDFGPSIKHQVHNIPSLFFSFFPSWQARRLLAELMNVTGAAHY